MMAEAILSPDRRRSLAAAIFCTSVVGTTMGLISPLLSLILDRRGVDGQMIGLSAAAQSLAVLAVSPVAPLLISRFGMRRAAGGCILIILAMLVLLRLFENLGAWFALRFILGGAVTSLFICTQTWVNRMAPPQARGRIVGAFGFLWSAGYAMGPLTIRLAGTEGWRPFLIALALVAVAGLPLLFAAAPEGEVHRGGLAGIGGILSRGGTAMAAILFLGLMDSTAISFLPIFGLRNGLDQADAVTMLFAQELGILAIQLPVGWAVDRMDSRRLLLVLSLLAFAVCLLLPLLVDVAFGLWPSLFLLGVATGGIWTVSLALMGQIFEGGHLASAMALRSLIYGIGSIAGPPIAGLALALHTRSGLPWMMAAVCALFLLLQIVLHSAREPRGASG
jgi:MFS family permease